MRFCQRVGCEGLTDLKSKLKASTCEGVPRIHQSVNMGDMGTRHSSQGGGQRARGLHELLPQKLREDTGESR